MPAVIITAAALILGGIGVVIGLLARQNSAPPATSASPIERLRRPASGAVLSARGAAVPAQPAQGRRCRPR